MPMRQRLIVLVGTLILATIPATIPASWAVADQNAGVALLIGNAAYPDADAPLTEPVTDARAFADELRRHGFDVTIAENVKKAAMQHALDQFYGKINSSSTALIFFSGFGIQSNRQSYMIPLDAQIWNESDVRRDGFSLDNVLAQMTNRGAPVKIAIIDASRRNPFERRFRSVSAGLAAITAPRGTVVMTSAPPDTVVDTSPPVFMTELLGELKAPDATIEQIFNRTRMDVSRDTKTQQVPWFSSSLDSDVTLGSASHPAVATAAGHATPAAQTTVAAAKPATATPANSSASSTASSTASSQPVDKPATSSPDPEAQARHDYVLTEEAGTRQGWNDFVVKYPSGYYHDLAEQQIAKLPPDADNNTASVDAAAPSDLAGFYRRGQHRAMNGDYNLALGDFDEVIRRDPNHAGALNNRCWVRALVGKLQDAMKDCNAALQIAPNYPDALDSRGFVNLKLGKLSAAISDYNATLALDPKHASALYGRGIAKQRSGDSSGAKSDIDAAKAAQWNIADEFASYGIK